MRSNVKLFSCLENQYLSSSTWKKRKITNAMQTQNSMQIYWMVEWSKVKKPVLWNKSEVIFICLLSSCL